MPNEDFAVLSTINRELPGVIRGACNRGLMDQRPKRINSSKTLDILIRNATLGLNPQPTVKIYSNEEDLEQFGPAVRDIADLERCDLRFGTFLSCLTAVSNSVACVFLGHDAGVQYYNSSRRLGNWDLIKADLGPALIEKWHEKMESQLDGFEEPFIVQEKPGRYVPLDMAKSSRKSVQKRLRNLLDSKRSNESQMTAPRGWGAGYIAFCDRQHPRQIKVHKLLYNGGEFDLELPAALARYLAENFTVNEPTPCWLLGASYVEMLFVASALVDHNLAGIDRLVGSDQMWGWNPTLSLLEAVLSKGPSRILIHWGNFPRIDLVEVS